MSNTIKAERATIQLGDISINVYRLPDGSYRFAGRNITDAIKEPANSLLRTMGVKSLKDLPGADLSLLQIKSTTGESFTAVSLDDAVDYWTLRALAGNPHAVGILSACTKESLEVRADKIFGVQRTDAERNKLLAMRIDRVAARFAWTDVIKRDQEARGVYLTDIGNREYAMLTRMVNRRLFGVPHFEGNRDNMTQDQQLDMTAFERMLKRKFRPGCDLQTLVAECLDFYESVNH